MKKFLTMLLCAIVLTAAVSGLTACGKDDPNTITVCMPDGATALALSPLMADDSLFESVNYRVVDSTIIQTFVTGANPEADICVLPVNLASKLLGSGETYQMLGTLTHGNLFILKKQGADNITVDNIDTLKGKTVGVVQLANVPGLTFKAILNDNGLSYSDLGNGGNIAADKVNLLAVKAEQVLPTDSTCDYFVVPEPAATTNVTNTNGKLDFAGDLQQLYGGDGYPQAVIVAKKSLIENDKKFVLDFIKKVAEVPEMFSTGEVSFETAVNAINSNITEGSISSLDVNNLNMQVFENCAIRFVNSSDCFEEVNSYLEKIIAINPESASKVSTNFYYFG